MTFKKNMTTMKYDVMFDPLVLLFIGASYVLTLFMGAIMVAAGHVTVGSLVTFITYLDMLVWPLMAIGFYSIWCNVDRFPMSELVSYCNKN